MKEQDPPFEWRRVYWTHGQVPGSKFRAEVKDPPCSGWQSALVLHFRGKFVKLFCPYTMQSYDVTTQSLEFATSELLVLDEKFIVRQVLKKWKLHNELSLPADYEAAAVVLQRYDVPIPARRQSDMAADPAKPKGGKPVAPKLLKPFNPKSTRCRMLAWMVESGGSANILEAMARFSMTRSGFLSTLYGLNKEYGVGYGLHGDSASVQLPVDAVIESA